MFVYVSEVCQFSIMKFEFEMIFQFLTDDILVMYMNIRMNDMVLNFDQQIKTIC